MSLTAVIETTCTSHLKDGILRVAAAVAYRQSCVTQNMIMTLHHHGDLIVDIRLPGLQLAYKYYLSSLPLTLTLTANPNHNNPQASCQCHSQL